MKDYRSLETVKKPRLKKPFEKWQPTARDREIVMTIPQYEGFLSVHQICWLFFPHTNGGLRAAYRRCQKLCQADYLVEATRQDRKRIPEKIYWLGERGYSEYKRAANVPQYFRWMKKPRLDRVVHDLTVNDFHLHLSDAIASNPILDLIEWYPGYSFEKEPDTIQFTDLRDKQTLRRIEPDSFFILKNGTSYYRFALEIELTPKDTYRLMNEKILPFLAWIKSPAYERRFGYSSGGFLFVFSDQAAGLMRLLLDRMKPQMGQDGRYFHFALLREVTVESILTAPIWHKSTTREPVALQTACNC